MATKVKNTVFISYRRANGAYAQLIRQSLPKGKYDVFFDFNSINSGAFEQIIFNQILARTHFIIILTPSALQRCSDVNDLFRREIETALVSKRNIIPLFFDDFTWSNQQQYLTEKMVSLSKYNGLEVDPVKHFDDTMKRLKKFLNIQIDMVIHPIPDEDMYSINQTTIRLDNQQPITEKELTAVEYFERAFQNHESNNLESAILDYDEAIRLNPFYADAYNNRGNIYASQKDYVKAIDDYTRAIHISKDDLAYTNRGLTYAEMGEYAKAIDDFTEAIKVNPQNSEAYHNRGMAYRTIQNYNSAIKDFNQAIKINPSSYLSFWGRGVTYAEQLDYDEAISNYNEAIKANPQDFSFYYYRGFAYFSKADYELAMRDFQESIKINFQFSPGYFMCGIIDYISKRYDSAINNYNRALEMGTIEDNVLIYRGLAYMQKGLYDVAISDINLGLAINPQNSFGIQARDLVLTLRQIDNH